MSSEDWDEYRQSGKMVKRLRQQENRDKVDELTAELDLEVELIQETHLRITLDDKKLDYFPQSGKATWLKSGRFFRIEDIESFIREEIKKVK